MAEPKNVRVEYSLEATVNTGNFENLKPGYKLSADVPDGIHPDVIKKKLKALVEDWVAKDVADINGS
jgi:hypothetical protein